MTSSTLKLVLSLILIKLHGASIVSLTSGLNTMMHDGKNTSDGDAEHNQDRMRTLDTLRDFGGNNGQYSGQLNFMVAAIDPIINYGCWCYFEDNHGLGRGHPVNKIDEICKVMHDGYECAIMDMPDCVPWEVEYSPIIGVAGLKQNTPEEILESCKTVNTDDTGVENTCGARACSIETNFLNDLLAHIMFNKVDEIYSHANGFPPEEQCQALVHSPLPPSMISPKSGLGGGGGSGGASKSGKKKNVGQKQCCGSYPKRFPYRDLGGNRACCGQKTYSTLVLTCCGDDELRSDTMCD